MKSFSLRTVCGALTAAVLLATATLPAQAHRTYNNGPSEASVALSLLPVAVVVAAPAMLLSAGVTLTVVTVEASAAGTVWVLERASDGARMSVQLAGGASAAVGTGIVVTAMSAGWLLSAAGQAIAFVPNEIGASLLYNERVTR